MTVLEIDLDEAVGSAVIDTAWQRS
jgi:hypothetical protein